MLLTKVYVGCNLVTRNFYRFISSCCKHVPVQVKLNDALPRLHKWKQNKCQLQASAFWPAYEPVVCPMANKRTLWKSCTTTQSRSTCVSACHLMTSIYACKIYKTQNFDKHILLFLIDFFSNTKTMQSIGHRTQQPAQPPPQNGEVKVKETEDLRRDLIAGAALSSCKVFARGVMQAIAERNLKKLEQNEVAFLDCVNNYAQVKIIISN